MTSPVILSDNGVPTSHGLEYTRSGLHTGHEAQSAEPDSQSGSVATSQ